MPIVDVIFHGEKVLGHGWWKYDDGSDEGTWRSRVMSRIKVPYGWTPEDYYEGLIVPQFLVKWRNLKTNFQRNVRIWVEDEFCLTVY